MNNNSNSNSNSNQNNSVKPNNLRNIAQKQARRRIVGAVIFVALVVIFLPFLMDNSQNQILDEVAVNIPTQTPSNNNVENHAPTTQPADNDNQTSEDEEVNIPDVATSLNSSPEEENQAVTARIIQKQDNEKQKLTSENQQKMIAEDKENKAKAEKEKALKAEQEKAKRLAQLEKEQAKIKNDDGKRAAAILAGFDEPAKKVEKTEKSEKPENKAKKYIISIGAFSDENNVKNLRKKLSDLKIASFTEAIDGGKKIRVRAGPFNSESDAQNALNKMQGSGISGKISASK